MCRSAQLRFDWTDVNFPLFVGTLHIALYNKSKNALFLQYNLDLAKKLPFIHKRNYIQSSLKILEALQRTFSKNIFSEKKIRFFIMKHTNYECYFETAQSTFLICSGVVCFEYYDYFEHGIICLHTSNAQCFILMDLIEA